MRNWQVYSGESAESVDLGGGGVRAKGKVRRSQVDRTLMCPFV